MAHAATYEDLQREDRSGHLADWLTRRVYAIAEANPYLRRVRWLQNRSDAELAELRIPRNQIVHRVFRDAYYR